MSNILYCSSNLKGGINVNIKRSYCPRDTDNPVKLFEPTTQTNTSDKRAVKKYCSMDNISVIVTNVENHYYEHEYIYEYVDVKEEHCYHHGKNNMDGSSSNLNDE